MIVLDGTKLTIGQLVRIARKREPISLDAAALRRVEDAAKMVEAIVADGKPVYGINTGFGKLSDLLIDKSATSELQKKLLLSHACGMGDPLPLEVVRAMMASRINALARGHSGVRVQTIQKLIDLLNADVIPVVFEQGSLGASGDLALLSSMALPLFGAGEVFVQGARMSAKAGLAQARIAPLSKLAAKEGLALINGTQAMNAIGALALFDAIELFHTANLTLSLTLEALRGIRDAFDHDIQCVRGHVGQIRAAEEVRAFVAGSERLTQQGELRVQDAYSLRCAPQVHGAVYDTLMHCQNVVETELNAVTDNPILFLEDGRVISAGNFHGEPLAFCFDFLAIAVSELANIAERRIERMVNPQLSGGLPAFLAKCSGINSGFMIVQYAAASIVSENKVLCHPASVDSIPSSGNQEDHVSMGTTAARKARTVVDNVRKVLAMEWMTACQAIDCAAPKTLGAATHQAYDRLRLHVPAIMEDELMYVHLHKAEKLLKEGVLTSLWGDKR
jgi:histidine ammonia-lyase